MGTTHRGTAGGPNGTAPALRTAARETDALEASSRTDGQAQRALPGTVRNPEDDRAPAGHGSAKPATTRDCEPARTGSELEAAVDDAMHAVIAYWATRQREFAPQASEQFVSFVDPAYLYGKEPLLSPEAIGAMFTEWLLFEYPLPDGMTPVEAYASKPPITASGDTLRIVRDIARTQFFSRFAILYKDQASGIATLRDVQTGRRYDVYDPHLCQTERWRTGTIGERLVRIDGAWAPVAPIRLYDRAAPEGTKLDGPGCFHPEDILRKPEAEHASFYLRLLRDIVGMEGRYRRTATMPGRPRPRTDAR